MTNNKFWEEDYFNIGSDERPYLHKKLSLKQIEEPWSRSRGLNYVVATLAFILYISTRALNTISGSFNLFFALITISYAVSVGLSFIKNKEFRLLRSSYWALGYLLLSYVLTSACTVFTRKAFGGNPLVYQLTRFPVIFFLSFILAVLLVPIIIKSGNEKAIRKLIEGERNTRKRYSWGWFLLLNFSTITGMQLIIRYTEGRFAFWIMSIVVLSFWAVVIMIVAIENLYAIKTIYNGHKSL